ncbi:ATP-dependent DNA ligase [Hypoxylon trugodes]|uniref:ATP-dependent DNA ligase n=1 Tax=Hypoxylon trugodes TaxID=326681 RepID=UPI002199EFFA|nr:ATP-dependent DNA ligase [Hypoxylon trugodes]KAI1385509.1 ATP-dependent DNA ligase [Hypoxylon trugodes]
MSSPAKKRKLNNNGSKSSALPSRGLEYFFSKQKQNNDSDKEARQGKMASHSPSLPDRVHEMTDEELARKLQAEWDREAEIAGHGSGTPAAPTTSDFRNTPSSTEAVATPVEATNTVFEATKTNDKGKGTLSLQSVAAAVDTVSETIPFDESPLTFDPSKYVPQLQEHWESEGGNASYALLTRCFVLVNSTSSRIKIVDTLVNCLRVLIEGDPKSLLPAVWLATNSISPPYISLELGLGGSAISKALKNVCGLDGRSLKAIYDKYGDAGDVAFEAKKKQSFTLRKPKPLTIKGVYQSLIKVANSQGQGSNEVKQRIVDRLLQDARGGEESRYVVRTLCQHLRIGAVKTTMLIALSRAFLLSRPPGAGFPLRSVDELLKLKKEELAEVWSRAEEIVKACFARRPNYNDLIPAMLEIGVCDELLVRCDLTLHIPLRPMLGSITRDLSEMLTKLQGRDFACEFKYDGQRAQVHCDEKGKVSIFSRHLEVMTDKYPDLVELVPKIRGEGVGSFIMEGEVVAVDHETGELKNFQTLTNRARKDVAIGSITIDVCLFAFDLMYLNGQPLLDRPFRERRSLLRSLFTEIPHHFTRVKNIDATSQDSEVVLDFFKQATDSKCEGIMVKILDNLIDLLAPNEAAEDLNQTAQGPEESETLTLPTKSKGKKRKGKVKNTTANGSNEEKKPSSRRKPLLATYEPDKRLDSWLKVKKDYSSSFDTLDLVPVAGWHGQGRKAKWWSPILMAVRNDATGSLEVVCKCISGFTDVFYKANKKFYDDGSGEEPPEEGVSDGAEEKDEDDDGADDDSSKRYKNVRRTKPSFIEYSGPEPDVWFEPQEVWEMAFADITLSPTYTAAIGLVSQDRGLSLRFPRFLKKREDKGIEEASTCEFLAGLYRKQEAKAPAAPAKEEAEEGDDEEL